jgi:hypothetical protein
MELNNEEWNLYLLLDQYSYNTMPKPMFQKISSYEIVYGFCPPEFVRFTRKPQLAAHFDQTFKDFIRISKMLLKPLSI